MYGYTLMLSAFIYKNGTLPVLVTSYVLNWTTYAMKNLVWSTIQENDMLIVEQYFFP